MNTSPGDSNLARGFVTLANYSSPVEKAECKVPKGGKFRVTFSFLHVRSLIACMEYAVGYQEDEESLTVGNIKK